MYDITFPYMADIVPIWGVGLYGILGTVTVIIIVEIFNAKLVPCQAGDERSGREKFRTFSIVIFHSISLFIFGVGVQLLLTEIGKRWAGRLRPRELYKSPFKRTIIISFFILKRLFERLQAHV